MKEIAEKEIFELIESMKTSVLSGYINLSETLGKNYSRMLVPIIKLLIEKCIADGEYPDIFKVGKVVPVYK